MSRTNKSIRNSIIGIVCSVISSLLSFVLQAVFIRMLGVEYSGINSLFSSIINILNLAELGFGNAIMFRLYKCITENDKNKISLYLSTYRRICYVLGTFVIFAGICCIPFLDKLVTIDKKFPEPLWILFVITIATSATGYLNNYKKCLIDAKQDRYLNVFIDYGAIFACHALQMISLFLFKNIYIYLIIKLLTTIVNGLISGYISKKKYKIGWKSKSKLPKDEWNALTKDIGSLAFYKFCRTLDANIDTFLISKFVNIATTGIYGSINTILSAINEILGTFNDGMIASVGDLYASDCDKKHFESIFYQSTHFTFLIYGICISVLAPILSPFSKWWIEYTLSDACIYVMLINFFTYGMGMNIATFRNSMGIFVQGWKRPAFTALCNLVFSIVLARRMGLMGTLLGTLIARVLTQIWYDPYLICKYGMNTKPYKYYIRYVDYMIIVTFVSFYMIQISKLLPSATDFASLIWHGILYGIISVVSYLVIGFLFSEHKLVLQRALNTLKPFIEKIGLKRR